VGAWATVEAACAATVQVAEVIEPLHAKTMDAAYAHFQRMYPALKTIN
jgi:xylulokinase